MRSADRCLRCACVGATMLDRPPKSEMAFLSVRSSPLPNFAARALPARGPALPVFGTEDNVFARLPDRLAFLPCLPRRFRKTGLGFDPLDPVIARMVISADDERRRLQSSYKKETTTRIVAFHSYFRLPSRLLSKNGECNLRCDDANRAGTASGIRSFRSETNPSARSLARSSPSTSS